MNNELDTFKDPEVQILIPELKKLEEQLNSLTSEKIETEKILSDFHNRHTKELGNIILQILEFRKMKFQGNKDKYEEAENDERQYKEQIKIENKKQLFKLTGEEANELKRKFRKATFLCHPDKVNDLMKDEAQRMFVELKNAYESNNLKRVTEILNDLERENYFKSVSDSISEKEKLKAVISNIRRQIINIENEIGSLKKSDSYQTIISIDNLDVYFSETKEQLEKELTELKVEIKTHQQQDRKNGL